MRLFDRTGGAVPTSSTDIPMREPRVIKACFCPHGHNLITDAAFFAGHPGITVKLKTENQEGLLALSPIIGDKRRSFFNFVRIPGELVDIRCPLCNESLPVYNLCPCGAHLVTLFTTERADFADSIGICQRIGCLHAEIKTNRNLRLYSRNGYFAD